MAWSRWRNASLLQTGATALSCMASCTDVWMPITVNGWRACTSWFMRYSWYFVFSYSCFQLTYNSTMPSLSSPWLQSALLHDHRTCHVWMHDFMDVSHVTHIALSCMASCTDVWMPITVNGWGACTSWFMRYSWYLIFSSSCFQRRWRQRRRF